LRAILSSGRNLTDWLYMNLFDELVDMSFYKDTKGNIIFSLFGRRTKGYIIGTQVEEKSMRSFLKKLYIILTMTLFLDRILFFKKIDFLIIVFEFLLLGILIAIKLIKLKKTSEKIIDIEGVQAKSFSKNAKKSIFIIWITMVLFGFFLN